MRRAGLARGSALVAGAMLLAFSAGSVEASKPSPYTGSACWDGSAGTPVLTQAWSGFRVDAYDFGFSNAGGGLGFQTPTRVAKHGTVTSTGLVVDDTFTSGGGELWYQGVVVESFTIDQPIGGWEALPAC